jgi:hypothetical protein
VRKRIGERVTAALSLYEQALEGPHGKGHTHHEIAP